MLFYWVIYLSFCAVIGLLGRATPFGFAGYFVFSVIFTPIAGALLMLVLAFYTRAAKRKKQKRSQSS